jgi:hypothetical protein
MLQLETDQKVRSKEWGKHLKLLEVEIGHKYSRTVPHDEGGPLLFFLSYRSAKKEF